MNELHNKLIMFSRIAVELHKKGMNSTVTICENVALISVFEEDGRLLETVYSSQVTESDLLEWWSAIENDVH